MLRKMITVLAIFMFLSGFCFVCYPWFDKWYGEYKQQQEISKFESKIKNANQETLRQLKEDMYQYNLQIFQNHQNSLQDAWDYEQEVFSLESYGINDSVIGTLEIDAMDIKLPLYLGASQEHLSKGATVLGQTSMPIGGNNTNTVIAAHRGYHGESMFRDIEILEKGDLIYLTNPWQTITYKVYDKSVITPDNIEAIKIIDNQDMLTLITCHPYTKNHQRYVVYCVREENNVSDEIDKELKIRIPNIDYELSSKDILKEKYFSIVTIICFIIVGIFLIIWKKIKK